jgi:hypothetical protein
LERKLCSVVVWLVVCWLIAIHGAWIQKSQVGRLSDGQTDVKRCELYWWLCRRKYHILYGIWNFRFGNRPLKHGEELLTRQSLSIFFYFYEFRGLCAVLYSVVQTDGVPGTCTVVRTNVTTGGGGTPLPEIWDIL